MDELPDLPAADTLKETTSPFPPPMLSEPTVSVVLPEEPKKRRTGLFVGVGVLVAAAAAVGGFVLLNKDDAAATYSLSEASSAAGEVKAVAFTMTMGVMGEEITAEAESDSASGLTHMVMDLGVDAGGSLEMILDTKEKAIYVNSALLKDSGLSVDTEWLKMDEEFLKEQGGDMTMFDTANVGNPLDAGAVFETAKSVTEIGFDEVDGVKVKHYEVVVDTKEAMKVSPQLRQQFEELGSDIPKELTYDVYVDEQNQIRRTTVEMSVAGQKIAVDIVIKPLTEPVVITVPDPDEVTDFADLL